MQKPQLSIGQIFNMSFGFLGIQFGFALQNANVSRIFQTLGADPEDIPILWLAAPITGLLVQPVIGYLSDRTWHPVWGRRRPFFAIGAILATLALIIMPNSGALWIAAGTLWIMDASINISMEPFRAFVGDMLPSQQRTTGFAMQSFFIGIGAVIASMLPWFFSQIGVSNEAAEHMIPDSVRYAFYVGAIAFLGAVAWTIFTTKEYPPEDMEEFKAEKAKSSFMDGVKETVGGIFNMPKTMAQLAVVQFFSWFALFAMWIYTTSAVTSHIYGSSDTSSAAYNEGADWVGICFGAYSAIAAIVAFLLPVIANATSRKFTHMVCLILGGLGLISIYFIQDPKLLLLSMVGVGVAWASILTMPYAILAGALPAKKMGYYMGVFNFFIVIPQITAAGILGYMLKLMSGGGAVEPIQAMIVGGISMIISGILAYLIVKDVDDPNLVPTEPTDPDDEALRSYFDPKFSKPS